MQTCANCGREIPPNETAEPCPSCGSLNRSATAFPATVAAKAMVPTPVVVTRTGHDIDVLISDNVGMKDALVPAWTRRIADLGYTLLWFRPTKEDPYWHLRIETLDGRNVDVSLADDPQQALADLLLHLLPPQEGSP